MCIKQTEVIQIYNFLFYNLSALWNLNTKLTQNHLRRYKLNFHDNCFIYILSCKCFGKQYVGETTGSFRYRWNNYIDNDFLLLSITKMSTTKKQKKK